VLIYEVLAQTSRCVHTPKYDLEHDFAACSHVFAASAKIQPQPDPRENRRNIMSESTKPPAAATTRTRRQAVAGIAVGLVSCARTLAQGQPSSTTPNSKRTSLHQEVDFKTTPQRIYAALLSSKDFAAFTGAPAEIDPKPGGAFSLFGGMVVGRNVELVPNQRIVQAWRVVADWLRRRRFRPPQRRMALPLLGPAQGISRQAIEFACSQRGPIESIGSSLASTSMRH
jgi:uncharacterized protein YndB with AHSA1/START domain